MELTGVRNLVLACIVSLSMGSCAFVLSQEQYRPVDLTRRADGIEATIPSVEVGFVWFVAGGHGGAYEVPWNSGRVQVHGGKIAWGQHWFGPLLPIFPVLMGAGATTTEVEVFVEVVEGTVRVTPNEFFVRPTHMEADAILREDSASPDLCRLTDSHWDYEARALSLTESIELRKGDSLQLQFPFPVRTTREFELHVPGSPGGAPRTVLPFRYENNRFLVWGVIPVPGSVKF